MKDQAIPKIPAIIYEDENYLVINKPAGLIVHGGPGIKEATLVDWLLGRWPEIKEVGDDPIRPGLVHRLDKEVSGLMVIAKTRDSFSGLKAQFQDREVNKQYLALVHGNLKPEAGEINFPIKRSSQGHKMAAMPLNAENLLSRRLPKGRDQGNIDGYFQARPAKTEFQVIKHFPNYTLVRAKIETGRTHQIRVHFLALGHPLVGDPLYYNKSSQARNRKLDLGRIFLVAERLAFKDLSGQTKEFRIELPAELTEKLAEL